MPLPVHMQFQGDMAYLLFSVCVYVCFHVYMCVALSVCVCVCVCVQIKEGMVHQFDRMPLGYMCQCVRVCVYVYVSTHYLCMFGYRDAVVRILIHTYVCVCIYIYIHMDTSYCETYQTEVR